MFSSRNRQIWIQLIHFFVSTSLISMDWLVMLIGVSVDSSSSVVRKPQFYRNSPSSSRRKDSSCLLNIVTDSNQLISTSNNSTTENTYQFYNIDDFHWRQNHSLTTIATGSIQINHFRVTNWKIWPPMPPQDKQKVYHSDIFIALGHKIMRTTNRWKYRPGLHTAFWMRFRTIHRSYTTTYNCIIIVYDEYLDRYQLGDLISKVK